MDIGAEKYRQFLDGDDDAFVEIIKSYKDGLILYLDNFTHDFHTAEDLMEDTFVKIITRKPIFHPRTSFKAWLYAIAGNLARDWCRKQAKHATLPLEDIPPSLMSNGCLEHQYLCAEQRIQLYKALGKINPTYAHVLYLVFFEDFSNAQVAFIMKKSNRQVENLLYRAKQALKSELEKDGFIYEGLS